MNSYYTQTAHLNDSPISLKNLSPQKYGTNVLNPNLAYTPSKLQNNPIYRQVKVTKKIQTQKNRIRELESNISLLQQKIRHLDQQNITVKISLQQQIDMYKKMLRQQQEQAKRLIKNLQLQYTSQIHKILLSHQQESKVVQAEKQEYESRIEEYLLRIQQLQNLLNRQNQNVRGLRNDLNMSLQKIGNTQDKLQTSQNVAKQNIDRLYLQIDNLNNRLMQQASNARQQLDLSNTNKTKQIQALKRLQVIQLDKFQNRKDAQIATITMQLKDIKNAFDIEAIRLKQMINSKDVINESLGMELLKQKDRSAALCANYDIEINALVTDKDYLISDITQISNQKLLLESELQQLTLLFEKQRSRNSIVVSGLQGEMGNKNLQLAGQNQRLLRTIQQYKRQLLIAGNNINSLHKNLSIEKSQQSRRLLQQIKSLRQVLLQSSGQMNRCKQQLMRMQIQIQRLMSVNYECEQEIIRFKAIISQQDIQFRIRRI